MANDDKYPPSTGRRQFVKGVVGSASLVAVGVTGTVTIDSLTSPTGAGGGTTEFFGIQNIAGPAPRAMPQIPVRIDDEGNLQGHYPTVEEVQEQGRTVQVAREDIAGTTYSAEWFQYCGVQGYEGIAPGYEGDNYFRYASGGNYDWQSEEVGAGEQVNVSHFDDYETWGNGIGEDGLGKPAMVTWRSQDTENEIPVQVLRSPRIEQKAEQADDGTWIKESTADGFIAWLDKCTHFCCVPSFKGTAQSEKFNAANDVYCPCHQSVYDPFSLVKRAFVAYPRPEES